jgi:hypothetical protein
LWHSWVQVRPNDRLAHGTKSFVSSSSKPIVILNHRNQKLKSSTTIQYHEKQKTLVPYTRSESDSARHLWSDFERDACLCHPYQRTEMLHSLKNLDMENIRSHLDGEPDKLLAFKRQWLRLHPNAYKGPLVSSTSNRRHWSSKPNKSNKKRRFADDRPSANPENDIEGPTSIVNTFTIATQFTNC